MTEEIAEQELVRQASDGDETALERLLLFYYDRLAARIRRRLPPALARRQSEEDILQQTFLRAFGAIASFHPEGDVAFYRWLCTIAANCLRDAIKADRALKRDAARTEGESGGQDDLAPLVEMIAGPRHTPSRSVAGHDAARTLQALLADLAPDYRRALELRYVQRLPVIEVSRAMERSPRAIHNLCRRGLIALRQQLGDSGQFFTRT